LALGLGVVFFFVGSLLHGLCIRTLQMCKSYGDANLTYALGGIFAFPVYWIILALCARVEWESKAPQNRYMAASGEAAQQYKSGQVVSTKCPKCQTVLQVNQHVADERYKYLIIACKCAKCNTNVRLPPP
jgi:RNase P subunit RPR2